MDYRVGTFSRVFSVSLHLGYLIMPLAQIEGFAETLSKFGLRAALPCQRALAIVHARRYSRLSQAGLTCTYRLNVMLESRS